MFERMFDKKIADRMDINEMSDSDKLVYFRFRPSIIIPKFSQITAPSEKFLYDVINDFILDNPGLIGLVKNSSEELQILAVQKNPYCIKYIENPAETVQLASVSRRRYGDAIRYIDNPSEKVKMTAIKNHSHAIRYIDNPSERVQLIAVKKNTDLIHLIKNPSKDVLIFSLLKLFQDGDIDTVNKLMKKFSDRNYPEFEIIRKSIKNDK